MKKRAKIITTVASLCLAVALMAFGVYAATSVTVGLTSTVKFEVVDIFVTIDAQVEVESGLVGSAYQYKSYTVDANNDKHAKNPGEETSDPSDTSESDWTATQVAYNSAQDRTATYTIRVTNDGAAPVTVDISALTFPVVGNTYRNSTVKEWDATANEGAGAYDTAANSAAETAAAPGNAAIAWLEDEFEVAAGKYVEFVLTRVIINDAVAIANNTASLGGSITVTLTSALD